MSLHIFKETIKACTNKPSSPSSSSSSITHNFDPITARKPPKSSLSQQLLRLQDPDSLPPIQPQNSLKQAQSHSGCGNVEEKEKELEDDPEPEGFGRPTKLGQFQFDHTGPFEPMVLSSQSEIPVVQVPASINCRLLEHQREGVKFLYSLYKKNHGGVLGDDMGLGKTIQTIAFLAAVYGKDGEGISSVLEENEVGKKDPVLIICPTSVIHNWEIEFSKWATFSVSIYHGANRDMIYEKLEAHAVEIVITSFDTYRIQGSILSEVKWEIVIVDEAHRLKNEKSKLYGACLEIKTPKRFGLTGTVMQNKIMELFNVLDWVAPGCLGTREHFREFYDEPLKHGQRSTAPKRFVRVADERKQHLAAVLQRYMLRRTKEETIGHLMMGKEDNVVFCAMSELQKRVYRRMLQLPDIQCLINKDLPCSCGSPLTQVECCKTTAPNGIIWPYLHRDNPDGCDSCPFCLVLPCLVKLQQKRHIFTSIDMLMKAVVKGSSKTESSRNDFYSQCFIRNVEAMDLESETPLHSQSKPRLPVRKIKMIFAFVHVTFWAQISNHLELIKPNSKDDPDKQRKDSEFASAVFGPDIDLAGGNTHSESFMGLSDAKHCGKMRALEKLMLSWVSHGDKVLLFSYSVRMLDILEKFLIRKGYCFSRLDGSTPTNLRQSLVDDFNSSPSKQVFLISTRAGGLGLNLVSANRVVIFDPNWNPAQDLQAQDRSFRFGQKRHVVVFRLLAAGSLEELVYSRQVYKQQLSNIAVSGKMEKRYFEGVQDCKEFQGELFGICNLFRDISDKLFTSEIIELHEKQGDQHAHSLSMKHGLTEPGNNFASLEEEGVTHSSQSETRVCNDSVTDKASKPVLEDMGIVYAHRNEDVVNVRAGIRGKINNSIPQDDRLSQPCILLTRRSKPDVIGKENVSSINDQKRRQFSLVAEFMGMGDLEFSKWLLSATPLERERALRDYKKRKEIGT